MPVWIAVPQPIAADFDGSSAILTDTFPPGFVSFDPLIFHWFNYLKKPKGLVCKVVFEYSSTTAARLGFTAAEAIGIYRDNVPIFALTNPLCFSRLRI